MIKVIIIMLLLFLRTNLYSEDYYDYDSKYVTLREEGAKTNFETNYHKTYVHFTIKDVENRYVKLYIRGLSNEKYTIIPSKNDLVSKETTKTESIAEYKSTEEDFSKMFEIESENDSELEFEVYYTLSLTGWAIFKKVIMWIIIILVILVVLFLIFKFLKSSGNEKAERIERNNKITEKKNVNKKNLDIFYEKIMENPYRMNYICPFCYIGKDGYQILSSDDNSLLVGSEDNFYTDDSEEYLNNFIDSLNNGRANKIFAYHEPQICKHFYHDECKSKYLKHLEDRDLKYKSKSNAVFKCYFCKNDITPQLLKSFCKPEKDEFLKIVNNYKDKLGFDMHLKNFTKNLVNSIYKFVINCPRINEDIKEKVKERRNLVLKYKKNNFNKSDLKFEIPLDESIEDWENKLEEKIEKSEKKKQNKKEVEMSYKEEFGRKIDLRVCKNCHNGNCLFCGKESSSYFTVYCHEKCYNKKYVDKEGYFKCNICNGTSSTGGKCCNRCSNSKEANQCYICSESFL